jgi:hypothetical protein
VLDQLLYPITTAAFLSEYWEKQPLHVARSSPAWCRELPSIDDLDAIISLASAPGLVRDELRLVRTTLKGLEDAPIELGHDGRPDLSAVYRAYATGWTIVVNRLHLRWASVARMAAGIEEEIGYCVGVNLYCTPSGSRGFQAHADGHDVFLLQMEGRKSWRIFPPKYELPLEDARAHVKAQEMGRPLVELTAEPGHLLYIPRGFIHEGAANSDASMHFTIGIHVITWVELLEAALHVVAEQDARFRNTVPVLDLKDEKLINAVGNEFAVLLQSVCGRDVTAKAMERVFSAQSRRLINFTDPHFKTVERAQTLCGTTEVARRRGLRPQVIREESRVRIEFGARSLSAPLFTAPALDFVSTQERFRVDDLPEPLSGRSKIVLVRRLIQEGLLTIPFSDPAR